MPDHHDTTPFTLRHLSLPARVTLALFLIALGFGYLAGLVQMHFAHARDGRLLPNEGDVIDVFHGSLGAPASKLERLLEAPEDAPFNGTGTMRPAFTSRSSGWNRTIKERPEAEVRKEREGERLALLDWIRAGAPKENYENDRWPLPESLADQPVTADYVDEDEGKKFIRLKGLIDDRCVRCHETDGGFDADAAKYPLETYAQISAYTGTDASAGMSLQKRAMFTHVHFLSFAMIYGVCGLIFALTPYPAALRFLLAPLPLLAQLVEMAAWWLVILDPVWAKVIVGMGGIVAVGFAAQILLTLVSLFGWAGRGVLVLLLLATLGGGWHVKTTYVDPYLAAKAKAE